MATSNSKKIFMQINIFALRLAFAMFLSLIAQMIPVLLEQYNLPIDKSGFFMSFQSIGGIIFILLGAKVFDKFNKKYILLIGAVALAVSLFAMATIPAVLIMYILLIFVGCANGTIDTMTNAITGEDESDNKNANFNLLHMAFAIGAIGGPFFADFLYKTFDASMVFLVFGAFVTLLALSYYLSIWMIKGPQSSGRMQEKAHEYVDTKLIVKAVFKVGILAFLIGSVSIIHLTWISMYTAINFKVGSEIGALALALYWGGRAFGMLALAKITTRVDSKHLLLFGSLVGGVIFILGLVINHLVFYMVCIALTGVVFGSEEPQTVALSMRSFPNASGLAASIFAIAASCAVLIVPYVMGLVAKAISLKAAMFCSGGFMFLLALAIMLMYQNQKINTKTVSDQQ